MGDLIKVNPGDPLKIPAGAYNAFVDAAQDFINRQGNAGKPGSGRGSQLNTILVKNTSGSDQGRFAVLGINGVLYNSNDNLEEFVANPVLLGVTPSAATHLGKFVVTTEPIAAGKIGRAWITGVCPVLLNVTDEGHSCAEVSNNNSSNLESATSGSAMVLWKDAGTGLVGALIKLGNKSVGTAGDSTTWAEVVRIPSYETYDSYIVLPESDSTPLWASGASDKYEVGTVVKGSNHRLYACILKAGSGTHDPVTDTANTYWALTIETEINHVLGFDGTQDMREFVPWLEIGTFVPILERESVKYIDLGFTYVGVSGSRSILWNAEETRAMAVWR